MHPYILPLLDELIKLTDKEKAKPMKAYLKNQFEFLGIPTPERRKVYKDHVKQYLIKDAKELDIVVKELWLLSEREFQYCAIEIMLCYKNIWQEDIIKLIEYCLENKSWWDTVDFLSCDCAGSYFKMFPERTKNITGKWNNSENIWLQRSSLLFQKNYKKNTDTTLLKEYILKVAASKEFFVQKAIGWILREYAKTNAEWVTNFVGENNLAPLSKREAMKHLSKI